MAAATGMGSSRLRSKTCARSRSIQAPEPAETAAPVNPPPPKPIEEDVVEESTDGTAEEPAKFEEKDPAEPVVKDVDDPEDPADKLSDEEKELFVKLFSELLKNNYIGRIESYSDEIMEYAKEVINQHKKTRAKVYTNILKNGSEIPINYVLMKKGDYLIIPAHKRHRIEWTSPDKDTVWLSVHY